MGFPNLPSQELMLLTTNVDFNQKNVVVAIKEMNTSPLSSSSSSSFTSDFDLSDPSSSSSSSSGSFFFSDYCIHKNPENELLETKKINNGDLNKNTQKNRIHQNTCFLLYAAMVLLYSVFLLAAFAT